MPYYNPPSERIMREFIDTPGKWPQWPVLPMKRGPQNQQELGLITPDYPHSVIRLNLHEVNRYRLVMNQLAHDGKVVFSDREVEVVEYESVEAMLAAGWRVD